MEGEENTCKVYLSSKVNSQLPRGLDSNVVLVPITMVTEQNQISSIDF